MTDDVEPKADSVVEQKEPNHIPWAEFLESYPLHSIQDVSGYYELTESRGDARRLAPTLRLHCPKCGGTRNFSGEWVHEKWASNWNVVRDFLKYTCRDCQEGEKTFCLISQITDDKGNGRAVKIGEIPELHVELPRSLRGLLRDEYSVFLKGLACEKRGLGIGAFVYYRRVVEAQKSHLIAEILRVAEKLSAPKSLQEQLRQAASEKQFSRAVEAVKGAIPESLLVDSHNPLKLLHHALSVGVHAETDENCLKFAHTVRLVLADLAKRLKLALAEQSDLKSAVSDLLKFKAEAKKQSKNNP